MTDATVRAQRAFDKAKQRVIDATPHLTFDAQLTLLADHLDELADRLEAAA